ncbi:MAG: ADP-forming succinate--CoA ligase subunit beta [Clostridia bacterium]|nr:ADP-forming succinate--CoA ligase subunit beta [Clostridia bacterium]
MDLMEYKARELFENFGMPVLKGVVTDNAQGLAEKTAGLTFPLVAKAQVQVGGRGKAGGVKFASDVEELEKVSGSILGMKIKGHIVKKLLIVEKAPEHDECYLSMTLDRKTKGPMIIFSVSGGVDIEQVAREHPERIFKVPVDPMIGVTDYVTRYIIDKGGLNAALFAPLFDLLKKLYTLFRASDCLLAEINPLAVVGDKLITLDAKVTVDDSALYRQPDVLAFRDAIDEDPLVKEARDFRFLYIPCDPEGNIAVTSNGSGMIMSCMDLISKRGMKVCAALDLGGGATSERIAEAVRIVLSGENTKALLISIFGGITRCDEVAGGIVTAMSKMAPGKIVVVRMEGTNKEKGLEILGGAGDHIIPVATLKEGIEALAKRGLLA